MLEHSSIYVVSTCVRFQRFGVWRDLMLNTFFSSIYWIVKKEIGVVLEKSFFQAVYYTVAGFDRLVRQVLHARIYKLKTVSHMQLIKNDSSKVIIHIAKVSLFRHEVKKMRKIRFTKVYFQHARPYILWSFYFKRRIYTKLSLE